jgi:hypothetical protein
VGRLEVASPANAQRWPVQAAGVTGRERTGVLDRATRRRSHSPVSTATRPEAAASVPALRRPRLAGRQRLCERDSAELGRGPDLHGDVGRLRRLRLEPRLVVRHRHRRDDPGLGRCPRDTVVRRRDARARRVRAGRLGRQSYSRRRSSELRKQPPRRPGGQSRPSGIPRDDEEPTEPRDRAPPRAQQNSAPLDRLDSEAGSVLLPHRRGRCTERGCPR